MPENKRIRYRIGINLGDVLIEDEDILGDGVNIAARLEGIAEPGGRLLADRALSRLMRDDWPRTLEEMEELRRR